MRRNTSFLLGASSAGADDAHCRWAGEPTNACVSRDTGGSQHYNPPGQCTGERVDCHLEQLAGGGGAYQVPTVPDSAALSMVALLALVGAYPVRRRTM